MKKPTATPKKKSSNYTGDTWTLYPIESNHNIVRLPILSEEYQDEKSITFDKAKSTYLSITERKTSSSGLISGTSILNLDGESYPINMTYRELCKVLFG